MNTKLQLICAWTIIPFLGIYLLGFGLIAGFLPPQAPSMSAQEIYAFYQAHHFQILIGQILGIGSAGFMLTWPAAVSAQMAKIERGPLYLLSIIQYIAGALLFAFFTICGIIWCTAAFRPDLDPATVRMLNDLGWLIFVMAYPEYIVQLGSIALAGFMDTRAEPFLPRWACYATLAVTIDGSFGGVAALFTHGLFAWNGLIGFWLPVTSFVVWLLFIILPFLLKAIAREAAAAA